MNMGVIHMMTMPQASSNEISVRFENTGTGISDLSADEIVDKYTSTVFGIAMSNLRNKQDAEDVFQDVFLIYFKKAPRLTFNDEEHRKAWLIRTTLLRCRKYAGSAWNRRKAAYNESESYADNAPLTSDDWRFALEEQNSVYSAMSGLPEKYRNVLYLFYFEDLPAEQIGQITKTKPATVRVQLKRGRELMREKLGEDYFYGV
jgi:RNA polymerase sigma-70 factor (ECF subfamily)